jgi:hypothetical protein
MLNFDNQTSRLFNRADSTVQIMLRWMRNYGMVIISELVNNVGTHSWLRKQICFTAEQPAS